MSRTDVPRELAVAEIKEHVQLYAKATRNADGGWL
jgi:2,4-dienoyl-CoA reductase-like NADH-dependent reductase (Old Yellow Enzyme family)